MTRLFRLAASLASSFLLLHGSLALATSKATASISNLELSTLDLTPDDGIAAGYNISVAPGYLQADYSTDLDVVLQQASTDPYQPGSLRVDYGPSFGEAHTSGTLGDLATAAFAVPDLDAGGYVRTHSIAEQGIDLILRPHTVLLVGGHFSTLAEFTIDDVEYGASGEILVRIDGSYARTTMSRASSAFWWSTDFYPLDEDFLLSYANGSDQDTYVALTLSISSAASAQALAPVPEPDAWMMLCAGLVLLSAAARSRRQAMTHQLDRCRR